ncbi:hypothetical protein [Thermoactinomyces mirandus]|uniref:hypothetical protein n=1 Tax=Thermoactinomyces mirandus TaxID=2756294 RepID=UPI0015EF0DCB|nr:hypothetical protein [Thermoactinomyces mirandus]
MYHIDVRVHDYDYVIIRGKKEKKKEIQKVFVEEWMQTSGSGQYPEGFDIDEYFCDMIEKKVSRIGGIIKRKQYDLQWFGINEDKED